MSKELEAFKRLKYIYVIDRETYKRDLKIIEQALTPPTEEEVCKALNEDFRNPYKTWIYDKELKCFWSGDDGDVEIGKDYQGSTTIDNKVRLMIGRFYEGVK